MSQPSSDGQRQPAIVILDFGSQYSELIARRVRETEVFSVVLGYSTSAEELRRMAPKGIILSGGPSSVYAEHAPQKGAQRQTAQLKKAASNTPTESFRRANV